MVKNNGAGLFRARPRATESFGGSSGAAFPVGALLKEAARECGERIQNYLGSVDLTGLAVPPQKSGGMDSKRVNFIFRSVF